MSISVVLAAVAVPSCASKAGNEETDRIARVVAEAISYPRQDSAQALARAAVETTAGQDGRLSVLVAEELEAEELVDPLARLVFRVHLEGSEAGWISVDPVTACYEAEFSFYGLIDPPWRIDCPVRASAIIPSRIESTPEIVIPDGSDTAVEQALAELPASVTETDVLRAVAASLPEVGPGPSGLTDITATPEVRVEGTDVGVALRAPSGGCLFGIRVGGEVDVWFPARVQVQPGELSCDPVTALSLFRQARGR